MIISIPNYIYTAQFSVLFPVLGRYADAVVTTVQVFITEVAALVILSGYEWAGTFYTFWSECHFSDLPEGDRLYDVYAPVSTPVSAPTVYQSSTNSQPSAIAPLKVVSVEPVTPPMLPAIKVEGLLTGAKAIAQPPKPVKLPAHQLSKTELIIQIQQLSPRKVKGVWKMRREALEQLYAAI
jgi:hypothetical protein